MDTTITTLEMCAGYGGIGLGLKNIFGERLRTIAYCELEGFAQANLISKMEAGLLDAAPIWSDLKAFPYESFHGLVDILIAGYPCQPFSAAGKRAGKDDPRHLWPWIADGIRLLRPRMCFFENVEGHISLGLSTVISDLEELGYTAAWGIFSASEVGAPHQRKRVFILAYDSRIGIQGCGAGWLQESCPHDQKGLSVRHCEWPSRPGQPQFPWEPPRVVAHSHSGKPSEGRGNYGEVCGFSETQCQPEYSSGLLGRKSQNGRNAVVGDTDSRGQSPSLNTGCGGQTIVGGQSDLEPSERWQTEPALGGDADGPAGWMDYAELCIACDNRTDELRLLGNKVVPATATRAFLTLMQELCPSISTSQSD